jgi:hypothetical protein
MLHLTEVCNRMTFLNQHWSYASVTCICLNDKHCREIWKGQYNGGCHSQLQLIKCFLSSLIPREGFVVQQISQGLCNDVIVLDKLPIISSESKKTFQFSEVLRNMPLDHCFSLGRVCGDTLWRNNMA